MTSRAWIVLDRLTGYRFEYLRVRAVAAFLEREHVYGYDLDEAFRDVLKAGIGIGAPDEPIDVISCEPGDLGDRALAAIKVPDGTGAPSAGSPASKLLAAAAKSPKPRRKGRS